VTKQLTDAKQAHIYTRCLVEVSQWALSNNVLHADWLGMQLRFYEDSAHDVVASGKAPTSYKISLIPYLLDAVFWVHAVIPSVYLLHGSTVMDPMQ
jgi:hypothetical protein